MKKMKYVLAVTLLNLTAQWSVAGELEDAVGFVNSMLAKCTGNSGVQSQSSGTTFHFFSYNSQIENGVLSRKRLAEIKGDMEFKSVNWDSVRLQDLDANFGISFDDGKGILKDEFKIDLTCHSGAKCIDSRSRFGREKFSSDISNQPLGKSTNMTLTFCSQSDRDRAAVALKDAIRLSGGKTSKY